MKSQVNALLHVALGILTDVLTTYPALQNVSRDYERLALYSQTRGLGLFTLDLPHLGSLLIRGLEDGRLSLEGPLTKVVSKRIQVPILFSGLWLRVFGRDACLLPEPDVTALFFLRCLTSLGKKVEVECSADRIQLSARRFHDVERALRPPNLRWDLDRLDICHPDRIGQLDDCVRDLHSDLPLFLEEEEGASEAEDRYLLNQIQRVADLILGSFDHFDPISFSGDLEESGQGIGFKHGPGAVSERIGQHEKSCFPFWPDKLEGFFPYVLCGQTAGDFGERPRSHEGPSRLMAVPKTAKSPRLIAAEPTSHMWCQKLIEKYMVIQFRKSDFVRPFIDLHDQSLSGGLVLQSSLDRSLVTVDLSDASDRLTCWTVERIMRNNLSLLFALHAARTRYLVDEVSTDRNFLKLKKFASQGTASTFPVQSIVFLCIALGSCILGDVNRGSIRKLRNRVRVYGDDIIIPRHGYERLSRAMDLLQLKVNKDKSFINGHFRESCGVDGYLGHDVTPVCPKTLVADGPASCQAVVDTSNNFHMKGIWNAANSLRALLPPRVQRGLRIVGKLDVGWTGLTSFVGSDESHLTRRWNSSLHRYEVRVWTLHVRPQKRDRSDFSALLDFFASKHNHEHARIVSSYARSRKTRHGLLWEPLNHSARGSHSHQERRSEVDRQYSPPSSESGLLFRK